MSAELWADLVAEAAAEASATLTPEQCGKMGALLFGYVDIGRDRHGFGGESEENREIAKLKTALAEEQRAITCEQCSGTGTEVREFGPVGRISRSRCDRCDGRGRHAP